MPGSIEIPGFSLKVNGAALLDNLAWQITRITVDDQVELPSMFTLELAATDETDAEPDWLNKDTIFALGDQVEIKMGWGDSLQTIMIGEITLVEVEYLAASLPQLVVRGYDRRHRLQRGNKTRTFVKMKDSDIASKIGAELGISVNSKDSNITHEYLIQTNQTDFAFLQARARLLHYELVMQNNRLYFQPASYQKTAILELTIKNELNEFRAQLSTAGQVSQAKALGWSMKEKKAIIATATSTVSMGGNKCGPDLAKKTFGPSSSLITNIPISDKAYAQQLADAALAVSALGLVRGEGQCEGNPKIKAGEVIMIKGVGNRFSGNYYITAVTHTYGSEGYATQFTGWRNTT
ncbi:hypothetical protein W03_10410 [Nitrosomonas sp. PY1]|uniref:phage late control D family protein n=1 Tax=Nitrosomonas sp. PY1 TaxID=1803906 RepID=UPI001FC816BE|nr:hypothetical protein [Nitrosomonas sp. PY1]GKS69037.1 hypothetical protein W03_10410 [Nitrosomonas sp. PY1]